MHKLILSLATIALVSCEKPTTEVSSAPAQTSEELLAVFVDRIPDEASPIHLARTTAQPGDIIVIKGQVMGSEHPFVEGRAAFQLGDREKLTPCNEKGSAGCTTPWDVCCDSKEAKLEGLATIQVTDGDGSVLSESIKGVSGLDNLTKIIVKGKVSPKSSQHSLIINAAKIQIVE